MSITSDLTTLSQIVNDGFVFNVPIYQRLYVWGGDQIDTLLEDLLAAYQQGKEFFYLGGTLVVDRHDPGSETCFDLIDGQQRFTTLWMMSLAWQESLRPFRSVPQERGQRPRVSFSIRPEVDEFFTHQLRGGNNSPPGNARIVDALARLHDFRERFAATAASDDRPPDFKAFTSFVFEKVQLVLTRVPAHTDLNKLFEVINNRGVQLQHHEILKARMLAFLSNDSGERNRYAALWDACSHMGNYIEKNLRDSAGIKISDLFDNDSGKNGQEPLASAEQVLTSLLQHHQAEGNSKPLGLDAVLELETIPDEVPPRSDTETYESREVRSISSFPMLLQHTLRIWLARAGHPDLPRILDKELLYLFSEHFFTRVASPGDIRSFIRLAWETRYQFDKHIIKWVYLGEEEQHLICDLYLNTSGKTKSLQRQRPDTNRPFALLQSMLYHSQQITTHYWLTPLLSYLLNNRGRNPDQFLRLLDNRLHCSTDTRPLVERSAEFLRDENHSPPLIDIAAELSKPDGVRFPHYWFYKLEFILWDTNSLGLNQAQRASFRMIAKNSVEHVSPQQAQTYDSYPVSEGILNQFGNLALVSRSLNSEYSNKTYSEKRSKFVESNRDRIDSLKMAAIYRSATWGDAEAKAHQVEMITLFQGCLSSHAHDQASDIT